MTTLATDFKSRGVRVRSRRRVVLKRRTAGLAHQFPLWITSGCGVLDHHLPIGYNSACRIACCNPEQISWRNERVSLHWRGGASRRSHPCGNTDVRGRHKKASAPSATKTITTTTRQMTLETVRVGSLCEPFVRIFLSGCALRTSFLGKVNRQGIQIYAAKFPGGSSLPIPQFLFLFFPAVRFRRRNFLQNARIPSSFLLRVELIQSLRTASTSRMANATEYGFFIHGKFYSATQDW